MHQKQYTFFYAIKEFFLYALACAATLCVLLLDVLWFSPNLDEYSITEISQELLLFAISFIFFKLALQYSQQRNAHLLLAGFFTCMLIRELDALFDIISHGFWLYPALTVTFITITATFIISPKQTLRELAQYVSQREYPFMAAGLICILIFSRLFGMTLLWQNVLADNYLRLVKNVVEEGAELLGYSLCFISTLFYRSAFLQAYNKQPIDRHETAIPD